MKRQRGQLAILVALIFTVMFVVMAMVGNIGLLVNAKMNLQNAADLGAYAGAAQQAQMMNALGILNYRLRYNIKEYATESWMTYNRFAQSMIELGIGKSLARNELFAGANTCDPPKFKDGDAYFKYPIMCVVAFGYAGEDTGQKVNTSHKTNMCQELCKAFPTIAMPVTGSTPVEAQMATLIGSVQRALAGNCDEAKQAQIMLGINLVHQYTIRNNQIIRDNLAKIMDYVNSISADEDKNLLLDNLESPINQVVAATVMKNLNVTNYLGIKEPKTKSPSGGLRILAPDGGEAGEVSIKDFKNSGFVNEKIKFNYPQKYLAINFNNHKFGNPQVNFLNAEGAVETDPTQATGEIAKAGCQALAKNEEKLGSWVFTNIAKKREVMTYYALRLESQPNLIFLPEKFTPKLVAYSAAKPFGSRIGPSTTGCPSGHPLCNGAENSGDSPSGDPFIPNGNMPSPDPEMNQAPYAPNFSFLTTKHKNTWDWGLGKQTRLEIFLKAFPWNNSEATPIGKVNLRPFIGNTNGVSPELQYLHQTVAAPTAFEAIRYIIWPNASTFSDSTGSDFPGWVANWFARPGFVGFPKNINGANANEIEDIDEALVTSPDTGYTTDKPMMGNDTAEEVFNDKRQSSAGGKHKFNSMVIRWNHQNGDLFDLGYASPKETFSSWAPEGEFTRTGLGRLGYSVKLIAVESIGNMQYPQSVNEWQGYGGSKTEMGNMPARGGQDGPPANIPRPVKGSKDDLSMIF